MKVLVVGGGAREHALAWKFSRERSVSRVFCAPGNPGTAAVAENLPIDVADLDGLAGIARSRGIDLTVVGPELPLDRGIVDRFDAQGLSIFGPSRAAAQLECSKVFAKDFMARHGIPTARYRVAATLAEALHVVHGGELGFPLVVKADGLAAGKGVVIAQDRAEADAAIRAAMEARQFGDAGARLVLEECLAGPEVSFFALCDGRHASALGTAQDHKRVFDDDRGPNTGGMGAFSPSPLVDESLQLRIMREIVEPVIGAMYDEGYPYRGFLYAGLMLTCDGPKVIEFNVRFGDPEAQVVIPRLAEDLAPRLAAAAAGALDPRPLACSPQPHVGIVLAAEGYPGPVRNGAPLSGLDQTAALDDVLLFHAGTAHGPAGQVVTAGGRVLTVVARGESYEQAITRAYQGVSTISFAGMHHRKDIGRKALHV